MLTSQMATPAAAQHLLAQLGNSPRVGDTDMESVDRSQVNARGLELSCRRAGAGPAIIWAHGLTSSMDDEDRLPLIDHNRVVSIADVVRYDAVGHGQSADPVDTGRYEWSELARDMVAVADALGIDRFVAAGASMGAATALNAALIAPDRVAGLALVIPPTAWATRAEQVDRYLASAAAIGAGRIDEVIAASALIAPPDPLADVWHARGAERLRAADPMRTAAALRGAAMCDLPALHLLADVDVAVTICAWTGDASHPVETATSLRDTIDGADLMIATAPADLTRWTDAVIDLLNTMF